MVFKEKFFFVNTYLSFILECVKSYLWIVGEYASLLTNIDLPNLLSSILCNETIASCPSMTDSSLNAAFKILIKSLYSMFNNTDLSIDSEKALLMSQITNILSLFQNFIEPVSDFLFLSLF